MYLILHTGINMTVHCSSAIKSQKVMAQTSKEGQLASCSHWVHLAICGNCEWLMVKFITAITMQYFQLTYKLLFYPTSTL